MAENSYPSSSGGGAVTDAQYEQLLAAQAPDGLIGHPDDLPLIFADSSGMQVKVRPDRYGVLRGFAYESGSSTVTKTIAANGTGSTRLDLVALRLDRAAWTVRVAVKTGTLSLTQSLAAGQVYEIPLAVVTVPAGAASIAAGNVQEKAWYVSDSGILCKAATRPPNVIPGVVMTEVDTARVFAGVGTEWRIVSDDAGASSVSPAGGVTASSTVYRRNGWAYLHLGFSRSGAMLANTTYTIGTVPNGFRPAHPVSTTVICPSGQSVHTAQIGTNGAVTVTTGANGVNATRSCLLAAVAYPAA